MRKIILSTLLGFGTMGLAATTPNVAKADWLNISSPLGSISFGPQYPAYPAPAYPAPAYPPVYGPAPVAPVPVFRPAPVYVPQHTYYAPNHWEHREWRGHEWRR
jgi:hypothetical protein